MIRAFVEESNRIEGLYRVLDVEMAAHEEFLALKRVEVEDLERFVAKVQPYARLRDQKGSDVRVGQHIAPAGGPDIRPTLQGVLGMQDPYLQHLAYQELHPFTDGNGRSGRVLWLWTMNGGARLGFLHHFYYQTLGRYASRPTSSGPGKVSKAF